MLNKYEFRKWNTYEEWYEVEAKNENEAREKLSKLGEEYITTSKFVGQEGETELYRTTCIKTDEDEEEEKRMEDEAKAPNRENYEEDEVETKSNAVQDSGFMGNID